MALAGWDETSPVGTTDPMSVVDNELRQLKVHLRTILEMEHEGPTATDHGLHLEGSARCFTVEQADVDSPAAPLDDPEDGWIVHTTDTKRLYIAEAGVLVLQAVDPSSVYDQASRSGGSTPIANGSWTDLDFTGGAATSGNVELAVPADGSWRLRVLVTFYLANTTSSSGRVRVELMESVAGGAFNTVRSWEPHLQNVDDGEYYTWFYTTEAPSAGDTHEYRLRAQADTGGMETDGAHQIGGGNITSYMEATLEAA